MPFKVKTKISKDKYVVGIFSFFHPLHSHFSLEYTFTGTIGMTAFTSNRPPTSAAERESSSSGIFSMPSPSNSSGHGSAAQGLSQAGKKYLHYFDNAF